MSDDASFDYDLFVIGGGSGGVRAARIAAGYGARVAVAEESRFGGTCVIRGCVPKKLMVYAAGFADAFEDAVGFGWSVGEPRFDWTAFRAAKDREIARLEAAYRATLERAGVTLLDARATIVSPHEVRLAGADRTISARVILVATGGRPWRPDIPGVEHAFVSDDVFDLPALPRRLLIAGGGYIACEFASVFAGLGVDVTVLYRGDRILRGFDADVRAHVEAAMRARGVGFVYGDVFAALERGPEGVTARLKGGAMLEADTVLLAIGRMPNTTGLGLEEAGVALGPDGAVPVDRWSRTVQPSVYAVGDVTDRLNLTPVAIREGHAFADTVFGARAVEVDVALTPTAVFTRPEVATIGLSEEAAREGGAAVEIYRTAFRPMQHTLAGREERMLMKLVVARETRKVLGVHIVGAAAAEMAQCLAVAVKMGATKEDLDRTVALHPTAAEELVTLRSPV